MKETYIPSPNFLRYFSDGNLLAMHANFQHVHTETIDVGCTIRMTSKSKYSAE